MHGSETTPRSTSGVPLTRADRQLVQVIRDLIAVRPANWEDSRERQHRAAWQAADAVLAKHGRR